MYDRKKKHRTSHHARAFSAPQLFFTTHTRHIEKKIATFFLSLFFSRAKERNRTNTRAERSSSSSRVFVYFGGALSLRLRRATVAASVTSLFYFSC